MTINKSKYSGFTLVEILIVLVTVTILVAIVFNIYSGTRAQARDNQRRSDVRAIQDSIESFYSHSMYYPSLKDINNPVWRQANLKKLTSSQLIDPSWSKKNTVCTLNGQAVLIAKPKLGCLGYAPTNNGASCENDDTTCNKYTLETTLEQGGIFIKKEL